MPPVAKAAAHLSASPPKKRIKVTETSTAPETNVDGLFYAASKDGGRSPLAIVSSKCRTTWISVRLSNNQWSV
jgi:hypothetical protein